MDALTASYFVAFVAGGGLGVASWLLGHGHGHHGHQAHHGHARLPIFNIASLAGLACVGGGVGLLARRLGAGATASALWAIPSGFVAAWVLGALVDWLARSTSYAEPLPNAIVGTVLARIGAGTTGEVLYIHQGARCSLPARSSDGQPIDAGVEVVVLGIENGIARVTPTAQLLERERTP